MHTTDILDVLESITYIKGDVTEPIGDDKKLIIHCCNNLGVMGAGVALAISHKWPIVRQKYIEWGGEEKEYNLGDVQFVDVTEDIMVANMIGQNGVRSLDNLVPVRYQSISECLEIVRMKAEREKASIHAPRFGCGLAGGDWEVIEGLIKTHICSKAIPITVYDFE